jgi:hypothetical protein
MVTFQSMLQQHTLIRIAQQPLRALMPPLLLNGEPSGPLTRQLRVLLGSAEHCRHLGCVPVLLPQRLHLDAGRRHAWRLVGSSRCVPHLQLPRAPVRQAGAHLPRQLRLARCGRLVGGCLHTQQRCPHIRRICGSRCWWLLVRWQRRGLPLLGRRGLAAQLMAG